MGSRWAAVPPDHRRSRDKLALDHDAERRYVITPDAAPATAMPDRLQTQWSAAHFVA
jgi:hypothetical protein